MTVIDLVTFGPILQQLDALGRDLTEQHRQTQDLAEQLNVVLERQRETAQRITELRVSLRAAADEHGRARLTAGDLHRPPARQPPSPGAAGQTPAVDWNPLLTVDELREVIALHHALLTVTPSDTDRIDLHQTLSDLYRRVVHVQGRHLAAAAGMTDARQAQGGRDVLLPRHLIDRVVSNLGRLVDRTSDRGLAERARAAVRLVTP